MIKKLRTTLLLPAELAETVNAYLNELEGTAPENPLLIALLNLLRADLEALNSAITAVRKNALVDDLAAADAVRDDLFIGFRDLVDAHKRRRDPELIAAYETIWPLIEKAGTTLYRLGYTEQSGKLEALLAELDQPARQAAITKMNATGIYTELKQAQEDFTGLSSDRLDVDASINFPTLMEATKRTVPHVNSLLGLIHIMDETEPEVHTALVDKLNAITASIMSRARARQTRRESGEEPDAFGDLAAE